MKYTRKLGTNCLLYSVRNLLINGSANVTQILNFVFESQMNTKRVNNNTTIEMSLTKAKNKTLIVYIIVIKRLDFVLKS